MNNFLSPINFKHFINRQNSINSAKNNTLTFKGSSVDTFSRVALLQKTTFKGHDRLTENLKLGQEAMDYVKELNLLSNTKMEMNGQTSGEYYEDYQKSIENRMFLDRTRKNLPIDKFIETTKKSVPLLEVGNCSEQAILAATYLKETKNIDNFALVAAIEVLNPKAFVEKPLKYAFEATNHVFLVLDLDPDAKLDDPSTWGKNAVIVDPWGDILAPATQIEKQEDAGLDKIKELPLFNHSGSIEFMNYARFIDPTKDQLSPYNWENYQRKINGINENIIPTSLPQSVLNYVINA